MAVDEPVKFGGAGWRGSSEDEVRGAEALADGEKSIWHSVCGAVRGDDDLGTVAGIVSPSVALVGMTKFPATISMTEGCGGELSGLSRTQFLVESDVRRKS